MTGTRARPSAHETFQRPWPGIWSSDGWPTCYHCSWAWRGETGRMEIKYLNAACPIYAHSHVTDLTRT